MGGMIKSSIFLVLILIVLASCSQKIICNKPYILVGNACCLDTNSNDICDSDESKTNTTQEQKKEIKETEQTPQLEEIATKPEQKEMNASIKELLTKAKTKVKSFSYTYFGPPNEAYGIDFTYKSNILKAKYSSIQTDDRHNPYDTVYLYLDSKNAVAYCENIGSCDNPDLEIKVSYDDHYRTMPFEILDSITFAVEKGTEQIDNRAALILEFEDKNKGKGIISVDMFWGMPLVVEYTEPKSYEIEYRSMAVNSVMDSDITH